MYCNALQVKEGLKLKSKKPVIINEIHEIKNSREPWSHQMKACVDSFKPKISNLPFNVIDDFYDKVFEDEDSSVSS